MRAHSDNRNDPRRWLILGITASGLFLICVDLTVLYVALPALTRDLAASNSARLWILNAYPIVVAGLLPGLGALGDRHGHRQLFLLGLAAFGIASLVAAYAGSAGFLVAARGFLGVGAAMMMPATLAIIRSSFADARERAFAIGVWSGVAAGGMALGPLIAGLLLEHFWWGSVFLINVPVVAVALVLTWWLVPRRAAPGGPPWDLAESLQIMVALTSLVYAMKELARQGGSVLMAAAALVLCILATAAWLRRQRRTRQPLIDLSLFRLPEFGGAFAAACLGTTGAVGLELILSQYLQLVEQRSPLQSAIVLLPMAIAGFIAGPVAGRALHQLRPATLASSSFALAAACVVCLAIASPAAAHYPAIRLLLLGGVGLGIGASVTYASSIIMNAATPERAGMAASIEEVGFELGNSLGVALFGSVMTAVYAMSLELPGMSTTLPGQVRDSLDEALMVADSLGPAEASALRIAARAALTDAFQAVLVGVGLLWLATGAMIWKWRARAVQVK